jgi:hypothetical protein
VCPAHGVLRDGREVQIPPAVEFYRSGRLRVQSPATMRKTFLLTSATHFCARMLRNIPAAILKHKAGNFCRLVDIAADHRNIAVWRNGTTTCLSHRGNLQSHPAGLFAPQGQPLAGNLTYRPIRVDGPAQESAFPTGTAAEVRLKQLQWRSDIGPSAGIQF